jgi:hypothetical protein
MKARSSADRRKRLRHPGSLILDHLVDGLISVGEAAKHGT